MLIENGKGTGHKAEVSSTNRLMTAAVTVSAEHEANHGNEQAYAVTFNQSPTAAGDCIFYMVNSSDSDIVIEGATIGVINCTADETLYFKIGDSGTRNSATALTPVNLNGGSGNTANGTFEQGADLDGGAATLTGGSTFETLIMAGVTDKVSSNFNFEADIVLPKNKALTAWVGTTAAGTYYITVTFYYANGD